MFNARQFEFGPFFAPGTPHEEAQGELGARRVCNGQAKLFEVVRASSFFCARLSSAELRQILIEREGPIPN